MKKSFAIMTVVLLSIITLAGCGTTKTVYETDTAKTDELQSQIDELNEYITELENQIDELSNPDPCELEHVPEPVTYPEWTKISRAVIIDDTNTPKAFFSGYNILTENATLIDENTYIANATHDELTPFVFFDRPDQTVDYEIGTDIYYRYDFAGTTYYYRASIFDINVSVYSVKTDGENIYVKNNNEENYETFTDIFHYWIMPF